MTTLSKEAVLARLANMDSTRPCEEYGTTILQDEDLLDDAHTVIADLVAENERMKREDFREMRQMLRAMQAGELTVSRGLEILNMWWARNWNDNMLPPVRQDLIEEDLMPVEIIDRLNDQLTATRTTLADMEKQRDYWIEDRNSLQFADDAKIAELSAALAAAEAREDRLREDFKCAANYVDFLGGDSKNYRQSIAQTRDNSALREMIAGVYEECEKIAEGACVDALGCNAADLIRALAEKKLASLTS